MRGAPQSGFASAIVRTKSSSSEPTRGRPTRPWRDFQVLEGAEALPVPANHGLRANEVQRISPPSPRVGEPHPEQAIEGPELRSLRLAAEQGELLPKRQVLEREVGAGLERRAQGTQQSEYEGHCCPWLARPATIVQSQVRVLANDS